MAKNVLKSYYIFGGRGELCYHISIWCKAIGINKISDRIICIIASRLQKPPHAYMDT